MKLTKNMKPETSLIYRYNINVHQRLLTFRDLCKKGLVKELRIPVNDVKQSPYLFVEIFNNDLRDTKLCLPIFT